MAELPAFEGHPELCYLLLIAMCRLQQVAIFGGGDDVLSFATEYDYSVVDDVEELQGLLIGQGLVDGSVSKVLLDCPLSVCGSEEEA